VEWVHTVNQERALVLILHRLLHGIFQQLDGNLHRHNGTLLDVRFDHFTEVATRPILLLAQQVPSAQMLEAIVRHQLAALRALARARPSKHKYDSDVIGRPQRGSARSRTKVFDRRHLERMAVAVYGRLGE
jgi:hypothetical protein